MGSYHHCTYTHEDSYRLVIITVFILIKTQMSLLYKYSFNFNIKQPQLLHHYTKQVGVVTGRDPVTQLLKHTFKLIKPSVISYRGLVKGLKSEKNI